MLVTDERTVIRLDRLLLLSMYSKGDGFASQSNSWNIWARTVIAQW
jgi:hypothetical protein